MIAALRALCYIPVRALWRGPDTPPEVFPCAPVGQHYLTPAAQAVLSARAEELGRAVALRRAARAGVIEQRKGKDRRQGERRGAAARQGPDGE